jgi:hypothetical protein
LEHPVPLFRRRSTPPPDPATLPIDPAQGDADAARLRTAMSSGDWPTARAILESATDPDDHAFFVDMACRVPGSEEWLPDVVRDNLDSTLPLLMYGARAIDWAWEARSSARARHVTRDQFAVFFERLHIAEDSLRAVVRREPDNTTAWTNLITTSRGLQLGLDESRARLDRVLAVHPGHIRAHSLFLQDACRKWHGSHEQMHAFAREAMLKAPAGSPLGYLVADAHIEHWMDLDSGPDADYIRSPQVRSSLLEAADRSVRHPAYRKQRGWPYIHNVFAMALSMAGEMQAAAEQFREIGDLVTRFPWTYHSNDPGATFCKLRSIVYARV